MLLTADYSESLCVIPGLFSMLQSACADRRWTVVEERALQLQAAAEALRGYAQSKMEHPPVLIGPERG
jgi:hypothetical protein